MVEALDLSFKRSFLLVSAVWSGGARYWTDWNSDEEWEGNTYLSTPDMEVQLPKNDGLFAEQDCRVAVPIVDDVTDFTQRVTSGLPFPEVTVTVREVTQAFEGGPQKNVITPFTGTVDIARRNYNGSRKKIILQCLPLKAQIGTVALGFQCNHQCDNALGDANCKIDLTAQPRTVPISIVGVDGPLVTIAPNVTIAGQADRFYHAGYILSGGVRMSIRDWRSDAPTKFFMRRTPPDFWLNAAGSLVAGCDGSIEVCRERWNNEANFNGRGYAMVPYNPLFEDRPS